MLLGNLDGTIEDRIDQLQRVLGIHIGAVGRRTYDHVAILLFLLVRVGVVQIGDAIQPADANLADVSHPVISMQGLFKAERLGAGIAYLELESQFTPESHTMEHPEIGRPPLSSVRVALCRHADGDAVGILLDGFQHPYFCSNDTMRRRVGIISFGPKPGKADRYATANGFTFFPTSLTAQEDHFFRAGRLPGSDLRAVQMHLSVAPWRGYTDLGQSGFVGQNLRAARDS